MISSPAQLNVRSAIQHVLPHMLGANEVTSQRKFAAPLKPRKVCSVRKANARTSFLRLRCIATTSNKQDGVEAARSATAFCPPDFDYRLEVLRAEGVEVFDVGTRYLSLNMMGDDVMALQQFLTSTGHFHRLEGCTNFFGEQTESALKQWQRDNGIEATGGFGKLSRGIFLRHLAQEQEASNISTQRGAKELATSVQVPVAQPLTPLQAKARLPSWLLLTGTVVLASVGAFQLWKARAAREDNARYLELELEVDREMQLGRYSSMLDSDRGSGSNDPKDGTIA
ncbi:hypothetical protein CYMTET_26023 [Cymbomonas tetramitiformis]|uniref:Peptidoglycan binding-like domain-containing protein n=1 Tax=Cymbomonas tetramitiformis TaxID=36881 RepID=A0AAE0KYN1_9CHLO|nr:hypothetical protein CYMTET_26023 [Cymbomonas tetramitiformis]